MIHAVSQRAPAQDRHSRSTARRLPVDSGRMRRVALAALLCIPAGGCGYMLGSPNARNVRSVHVPVFTTDIDRRGLEYQLTEAVQREIKQRTHFRIEDAALADTVLRGHIVHATKNVLGETMIDDPRELQFQLAVRVTWEDRRTGNIIAQNRITPDSLARHLVSDANFAPEVGHSLATVTQEVTREMGARIVDMMEAPW